MNFDFVAAKSVRLSRGQIDECSPLQLYATDSYFLGGKASYRWDGIEICVARCSNDPGVVRAP